MKSNNPERSGRDPEGNFICPQCGSAMFCENFDRRTEYIDVHFENGSKVLLEEKTLTAVLPEITERKKSAPTKLVTHISFQARYRCRTEGCKEKYTEYGMTSNIKKLSVLTSQDKE